MNYAAAELTELPAPASSGAARAILAYIGDKGVAYAGDNRSLRRAVDNFGDEILFFFPGVQMVLPQT